MGTPTGTVRRIFVGDIQGCREELERLLEVARFDPATDELHPVGDFVNRGPDSAGVLRLCRQLGAGGVLGNHDVNLFAVARGERRARERDTFESVLGAPDREELLAWLAQRPFLRVWPDLYLVHAGLHPAWDEPEAALGDPTPLEPGQAGHYAVSVRTCNAAGEPGDVDGNGPAPPYRPWDAWYDPARHAGRRVVFGHWSTRGLVDEPGALGLDTGCVWGGELTGWIAEEERLVRVPARRAYSPIP
ncbi:MAG: metallophosphoesterase [Planctomycetota bacterium]